jgi:hypothetical protein
VKPLSERDRRALKVLGVALGIFAVAFLATWFWPSSSAGGAVVSVTVPQAEKRLKGLRRLAGGVPAREAIDRRFSALLAGREAGLINAETSAQAQAQLLQVVRRVAQLQSPAMPIGASDFTPVRAFHGAYGEVSVNITTDCGIEQIVNFLSDLSRQKELLAVTSLQLGAAHPKKKTLPARIAISGLTPKRLAPQQKQEVLF